MPNAPKHSTPEYRATRDALIPAAYADPDYRCPFCGLTMAEQRRVKPHETYDLGHAEPPWTTGYAAWHASCNRRLAAQRTNAQCNGYDVGL